MTTNTTPTNTPNPSASNTPSSTNTNTATVDPSLTSTPSGSATLTPPSGSTTTTPPTAPKRGGIHSIYGIYAGGAPLNDAYALTTTHSFHHVSQVRNHKQANTNESSLLSALEDSRKLKFNGNLDLTACTDSEFDKEGFIRAVKEKVKFYGLHTFFYLPDTAGTMKALLDSPHDFTFDEVTDEYKRRLTEPHPVLDTGGSETPESVIDRFKTFDEYELADRSLSRLCVECLVSTNFREKVIHRFSHLTDFEVLPGQLYFMMIFDTCMASASVDIGGAITQFTSLSLSSFPGENIASFSIAALKLIKIMNTAYSMDVKTGSKLLRKIQHTQSDSFNQKTHTFLDVV